MEPVERAEGGIGLKKPKRDILTSKSIDLNVLTVEASTADLHPCFHYRTHYILERLTYALRQLLLFSEMSKSVYVNMKQRCLGKQDGLHRRKRKNQGEWEDLDEL